MNIKRFFSLGASWLAWICVLHADLPAYADVSGSWLDEEEEIIRERLPNVVSIVTPTYNADVRSYLNTYLNSRAPHTAEMLGWAAVYFPMFEQALAAEGLPLDLKYLAIVESALNPCAISRSGAGGLWQFMKPTAKEFGLKMTTYVDERMDPEKATRAAASYLKRLFALFSDWELALAAYNAGPGRVKAAIKRAGSEDYWKIAEYLPAETRSYVPGFIAASYLVNYHAVHDILPRYPEEALGPTTIINIRQEMSLAEVAKRSGLSLDLVSRLNPVFVRGVIPASHSGFDIVLPSAAATLFNSGRLMELPPADNAPVESVSLAESSSVVRDAANTLTTASYRMVTTKKIHAVRSGDNLSSLARRYNCSVKDLMKWNKLRDSRLAIGQRLEIRMTSRELIKPPVVEAPPPPARSFITLDRLPGLAFSIIPGGATRRESQAPLVTPQLRTTPQEGIVLQRRQSVRQACLLNGLDFSQVGQQALETASVGDLVRLQ